MRLFAETESLHGSRVSDEPALINDYVIPAAISLPTVAALAGIWGQLDTQSYVKLAFSGVVLAPASIAATVNTINSSSTVAIRHAKSYGVGAVAGLFLVAAATKADASTINAVFPIREQDTSALILDT